MYPAARNRVVADRRKHARSVCRVSAGGRGVMATDSGNGASLRRIDQLGVRRRARAAYDCGARRILRALSRHPDATFWDIDLPKETAGYVPRLLALAALIRTPCALAQW